MSKYHIQLSMRVDSFTILLKGIILSVILTILFASLLSATFESMHYGSTEYTYFIFNFGSKIAIAVYWMSMFIAPFAAAGLALAYYTAGLDNQGRNRIKRANTGYMIGFLGGILLLFVILAMNLQDAPGLQGAMLGALLGYGVSILGSSISIEKR